MSTNISTRPLLLGGYAVVVIGLIGKASQNLLNSPTGNWLALSEIISSGKPYLTNSPYKKFIVTVEFFLHWRISGHSLKLSTTTKWCNPFIGPPKSICNPYHEVSAFGKQFNCIKGGFLARAQPLFQLPPTPSCVRTLWDCSSAPHKYHCQE